MTPTDKLTRRRQQSREYYHRKQAKIGKQVDTTRKGKYAHLTPQQYRELRTKRQRELRAMQPKQPRIRTPKYTPEQAAERRRVKQREDYRLKHPKKPRLVMSKEEKRERQRIAYRKRMDAKGKIPFKEIPKMTHDQLKERKRLWYARTRTAAGFEYTAKEELREKRRAKRMQPKEVKPPKPKLTDPEKIERRRAMQRANYAKKMLHKVDRPIAPRPVRKPRPKEVKPKPEVMPTLVRDESDYVSVRIDAKTVIRVPPGKDIEQVRQRFIAKMLQNSRV